MRLPRQVLDAVAASLGVRSEAVAVRHGGGGFTSSAVLEVKGDRFFLKWLWPTEEDRRHLFVREAQGLEALARPQKELACELEGEASDDLRKQGLPGGIDSLGRPRGAAPGREVDIGSGVASNSGVWRPPVVGVVAASNDPPFLLLEYLEPGSAHTETWARLGRDLASMHRGSADAAVGRDADRQFGFPADNWLGATPQPNGWQADWVGFFRHSRLGFQLELLRERGLLDPEFESTCNRLLERLPSLIGDPQEPPCVLHGDLWSGNVMIDAKGRAVLIDPAVYCGRREADLAMTRLFGGFDRYFYRGYEEVWALAPGSEERLQVYELYHLMNHWNLFGSGYRGACLRIAQRFA